MTYSVGSTKLVVPGMSAGPAVWYCSGTGPFTEVDGADYVSDGERIGMKVGDIVFYYDTDTYTVTIHAVKEVDSDGNATLTDATLA
jgi:hypothetical protein